MTSGNKKEFEVIDIKQQKSKRNYKNSGIIQLVTCDLIKSHTYGCISDVFRTNLFI